MYDKLTENDIKKMQEEIDYRKLVVRPKELEAVKEARAQFLTTYAAMVTKAQYFGRVQQMYQSPKQLEQTKKEHVAVSNDEAQKHLNALMKTLNINNRKVPQPQKLKPKKVEQDVKEPWPDPFDQPGDYLENCARDGVNVPTTVKKHIGGTA